ncbi:GntR family transcriptional regulator, partial [Streptomyces viridochromogenes]
MRRMPGQPRNSRPSEESTNSRIQRQVMQLIIDRRLRAGALLPTEAELMEDLGVSRNSVREALKALQALDIVEIRHGYGTYVGQASLTPLIDGLTFRTLARHDHDDSGALAEILQVREVLEEGLIRRVAATVTEGELDRLESVVSRMEAA